MLSVPTTLAVIGAYLGLLVWIGLRAERVPRDAPRSGALYGLSLATLCSAWTYFGSIGDAANGSWLFVANAMGPVVAITVGFPVWQRVAILAKQENVGSLADFLAARYGKSRSLGIVVAAVVTVGALPYIALQLSILVRVWAFAAGSHASPGPGALAIIALLAAIAVVFGARRPSLTQQNRGFVDMLAVESCVKLAGLAVVAAIAVGLFAGLPRGGAQFLAALPPVPDRIDLSFVTLVLLCTATAFTLPRQFHLGFVTLEDLTHIRVASWIVPAYFAAWVMATLLISVAIRSGFGMPGGDPYLQVVAMPLAEGRTVAATLALLGGLSAGAAMVVVETTAISAMVSNEIILPLFAPRLRQPLPDARLSRSIQRVRRGTIIGISALAWCYFRGIGDRAAPNELGLTALAAFAQLFPALIGGIYWQRGHGRGAIAGIAAGMLVWSVLIAAPAFVPPGLRAGTTGAALWWPLIGVTPMIGIYLSLAVNVALYVAVSLRARPELIDRIQANNFVSGSPAVTDTPGVQIRATVADLRRLLGQFLGAGETDRALLQLNLGARPAMMGDDREVSPTMARAAERLLAGVIGAPSARNVVAIALSGGVQDEREINRILDEAGHAIHFSRELLQTSLESLPQGICVVDEDLNLVAWNNRYLDLMGLVAVDTFIGRSLVEAARERAGGERMDPGPAARLAGRVVEWLGGVDRRWPCEDEIALPDGLRLRLIGRPLAGGDFLVALDDITEIRRAQLVLARSNEELERRVEERTAELSAAKQAAEQVTGAQQRFVAAASHDLVQPLHAARLFIGNALLAGSGDHEVAGLLQRADQAVEGAHRLLRALLNLSQLEAGAVQPRPEPVDAGAVLASLAQEFAPQADLRGLELMLIPTRAWILTDRDLLTSMLQNLLANALRYTPSGRVVLALRRHGDGFRIEVRDSGVGIAPDKVSAVFDEFSRLSEARALAEGAGLGLSIVARIAKVLGHQVTLRSAPGRGSVFGVVVPAAPAQRPSRVVAGRPANLAGLKVLCVDDERDVLSGTAALIERWGGVVRACETAAEALAAEGEWDVVLADYLLGDRNGLEVLQGFAGRARLRLLVTATPDAAALSPAQLADIVVLAKPLAPLELQRWLVEAAAPAGRLSLPRASS